MFCDLVYGLLIYRLNIFFLLFGLHDFQRKKVMSKIISSLINPDKKRTQPYTKNFGTLNLADSQTIQSWLNIKLCLFDFGKKFSLRVQLYSSFILIINIFLGVRIFLKILFFETKTEVDGQVIYLTPTMIGEIYDIVLAIMLLVLMISIGSSANHSF